MTICYTAIENEYYLVNNIELKYIQWIKYCITSRNCYQSIFNDIKYSWYIKQKQKARYKTCNYK